MLERNVRSPEDALVYLVDCTLATVSSMAMKKSRTKGEFQRQISIAQKGLNWLREMGIPLDSSRAEDICEKHNGSVEEWANTYTP